MGPLSLTGHLSSHLIAEVDVPGLDGHWGQTHLIAYAAFLSLLSILQAGTFEPLHDSHTTIYRGNKATLEQGTYSV